MSDLSKENFFGLLIVKIFFFFPISKILLLSDDNIIFLKILLFNAWSIVISTKDFLFINFKFLFFIDFDPFLAGINAIRLFNDLNADEIIILDINASKSGNSPNLNIIEDIASEAFMPVSYGGGINNKILEI